MSVICCIKIKMDKKEKERRDYLKYRKPKRLESSLLKWTDELDSLKEISTKKMTKEDSLLHELKIERMKKRIERIENKLIKLGSK